MSTIEYAHIEISGDSIPIVAGTSIKVMEIAQDHLLYGWNAEEIHREFPLLSLGQIYSALGYYYDHQEEMDAEIQQRRETSDQIRDEFGDGPVSNAIRTKRRQS
jgi:uncharacterized protein (DUF433 family)